MTPTDLSPLPPRADEGPATDAPAADFLRAGPCHFALIDSRSERSFVQRAETVALRYSLIQRIEGYNISIGKPVSMTVFRSQASP